MHFKQKIFYRVRAAKKKEKLILNDLLDLTENYVRQISK